MLPKFEAEKGKGLHEQDWKSIGAEWIGGKVKLLYNSTYSTVIFSTFSTLMVAQEMMCDWMDSRLPLACDVIPNLSFFLKCETITARNQT